jgi:uncharacterized Rmd1/YagE family protein
MRCTAYSTAAGYDISKLFPFLQMTGAAQQYRDVIHYQPKDDKRGKKDVLYFPYGVMIFWGFSQDEEKSMFTIVKKFERDPLAKPELDEFTFIYGPQMKIEEDEIVLEKKDPITKLAISYAIAQSVKLTVFEETIAKRVEQTEYLPKSLAMKGKIPLSRKETSKKMGEIFLERNYINLHAEILDTPEFFWEHSEVEPFYRKTIHYLDVTKRVELLNRRLNLLHELFEILGNELDHQQTSRLEVTIIALIGVEVILALLHDIFHIF